MGVESRQRTCIIRWSYNVASSNALWHIDGQHSLVRWKLFVHDSIDQARSQDFSKGGAHV